MKKNLIASIAAHGLIIIGLGAAFSLGGCTVYSNGPHYVAPADPSIVTGWPTETYIPPPPAFIPAPLFIPPCCYHPFLFHRYYGGYFHPYHQYFAPRFYHPFFYRRY